MNINKGKKVIYKWNYAIFKNVYAYQRKYEWKEGSSWSRNSTQCYDIKRMTIMTYHSTTVKIFHRTHTHTHISGSYEWKIKKFKIKKWINKKEEVKGKKIYIKENIGRKKKEIQNDNNEWWWFMIKRKTNK